jgi:hypothetical protein
MSMSRVTYGVGSLTLVGTESHQATGLRTPRAGQDLWDSSVRASGSGEGPPRSVQTFWPFFRWAHARAAAGYGASTMGEYVS